ncbi:MAG: response regulator transcription factor [Mucilaginibacter polytrichastri]|nr:response regulator transcription factor [Mucilaginibacter polytrichastri]
MIKCLILDDEQHAIDLLKLHVEQTPFLQLEASTTDPVKALEVLNSGHVDLLFLDIQMPAMTGLEFMKLLNGKYKIILTTAFREYALDGFEHNVVDYLLKPVIFSRFFKAAQRAQDLIAGQGKGSDDFMLVKAEYKGKLIRIKYKDIVYIEGMRKYVRFHLRESEPVTSLLNIGGMEERLPADQFIRVHKSFIVAIPYINMINGNMVHLEFAEEKIPVGLAYREPFMNYMRDKIITNPSGKPT